MTGIYKIATKPLGEDKVISVKWAPSQGAANKARRELMEEHGAKMADVSIESLDFPTNKVKLLEWLNENHIQE